MTWAAVAAVLLIVGATLGVARHLRLRCLAEQDERFRNLMHAISTEFSHQMRNPLSALKGQAQLLSRSLVEAELRQHAERIVRESIRLEKAIADSLVLWGAKQWCARPIDPSHVAKTWVGSRPTGQIRVDVTRAPPRWTLDAERFVLVLDLLLRAILAKRRGEEPIDLVVMRHDRALVVWFGSLAARTAAAGKPERSARRDILYESSYAIAEDVARRHRGRFAVWETADCMPLFRLVFGDSEWPEF